MFTQTCAHAACAHARSGDPLGSGSTHVIVTVVLLENNYLVDAFVMPSAAGRRLHEGVRTRSGAHEVATRGAPRRAHRRLQARQCKACVYARYLDAKEAMHYAGHARTHSHRWHVLRFIRYRGERCCTHTCTLELHLQEVIRAVCERLADPLRVSTHAGTGPCEYRAGKGATGEMRDRAGSFCGHDFVDFHIPVAVGELDDFCQGEIPGLDYLLIAHAHLDRQGDGI